MLLSSLRASSVILLFSLLVLVLSVEGWAQGRDQLQGANGSQGGFERSLRSGVQALLPGQKMNPVTGRPCGVAEDGYQRLPPRPGSQCEGDEFQRYREWVNTTPPHPICEAAGISRPKNSIIQPDECLSPQVLGPGMRNDLPDNRPQLSDEERARNFAAQSPFGDYRAGIERDDRANIYDRYGLAGNARTGQGRYLSGDAPSFEDQERMAARERDRYLADQSVDARLIERMRANCNADRVLPLADYHSNHPQKFEQVVRERDVHQRDLVCEESRQELVRRRNLIRDLTNERPLSRY